MTPAQIGFASTCPSVTVPGGASCAHAIQNLQDIVQCVDCLAEFKADCTDRAQVPEFASYPPECSPPVTPCSTVTVTGSISYSTADFPNVSGIQLGLNYPGGKVSIPGTGNDPQVLGRVDNLTGISNGLFSAGDSDGNPNNSTLNIGLVSLSQTIPTGNFARAHFDCVAGQPRPSASDFSCAASGSTLQGGDVPTQCSLVVDIQ